MKIVQLFDFRLLRRGVKLLVLLDNGNTQQLLGYFINHQLIFPGFTFEEIFGENNVNYFINDRDLGEFLKLRLSNIIDDVGKYLKLP